MPDVLAMSARAEVVQVIRTRLETRGRGVEDDTVRSVEQFWSLDGQLLAENDPETAIRAAVGDTPATVRRLTAALQKIATRIPPSQSDELARKQWEIAAEALRG